MPKITLALKDIRNYALILSTTCFDKQERP